MKKTSILLPMLAMAISILLPSCSNDESQTGDTGYFTRNLLSATLEDQSTMYFIKNNDGVAVTFDQKNIRMLEDGKATLTTYQGAVAIPENVSINNTNYSVNAIGKWAFSNCRNVTAIQIPSSVTSLGDACFSRTSGLQEINIPDGIQQIPSSCFIGAVSLMELEFPSSVTSVGDKAFWGCTKLKVLHLLSTTPPAVDGELTNDYSITTLYVPAGCEEAYQAHPEWGKFQIKKD